MAKDITENNIDRLKEEFNKELSEIEKVIQEVDSLYDETKEHFDEIRNARVKGSLIFIQGQTSNLISMKNTKASLIKEKVNIKKTIVDLDLKNKKVEGTDEVGKEKEFLMNFFKELNNSNMEITCKTEKKKKRNDDELLSNRIKELEESGELSLNENELAAKFESQNVKIAVVRKGKKWKFIAINENYEIVDDYPLPDKKMFEMRFEQDKDDEYAIDQNERVYEIVEID